MHYTRSLFATLTAFVVGALGESGTPITAKATFFSAGGEVGSCGTVIQDSDFVVALPSAQFDMSLCGSEITVTHAGNTIAAVIAEQCPACSGNNIDLTTGAFETLAPLSEGLIDVTYTF